MTMQPRIETESRAAKPSSESATSGFTDELDAAARALEEALAAKDLGIFYRSFRETGLPFFPLEMGGDPHTTFRRTVDVVWRLGTLSPALALAVENHYSVVCPLATLPAMGDEGLEARRLSFLETVRTNRWLVANTNSRVHGNEVARTGTMAKSQGTQFEVSGEAVYMSLAGEGDVVALVTFLESGAPIFFACPLKGNPAIEIGPLLFPDAMQDSDTRRVTLRGLKLDESHLLVSGEEHPEMIIAIITYQQLWHQALLAALSLGTAARAIEEGRLFLRSAKRPDGVVLAELDGMVVDMGRQALRYRVAKSSVDQAGLALARVGSQPLDGEQLADAYELAAAAKYWTTGFAEDVVGVVRRIIGARSFTGGHGIQRLSQEVVFGPLGGEVNALIERRAGERVLSEESS